MRSHMTVLPSLTVGPAQAAAAGQGQVVVGNGLVPVHRVGPRLLAPTSTMTPTDEQLGHLITPEIYRAYCLYNDKSHAGISTKDGGAKLRLAVMHAAPGISLGAASEQHLDKCKKAAIKERVSLQAFGKLMRDLTALHHRSQQEEGVTSLGQGRRGKAWAGEDLASDKAFRRHDRDGSGDIDHRELRGLLKELELSIGTEDQVASIMRTYDVSGDRRLDLPEFLHLVAEIVAFKELAREAEIKFRKHDRDNNGQLDMQELRNALKDLGLQVDHHHVSRILAQYDADRSQHIEIKEFLELVADVKEWQEVAKTAHQVFVRNDRDHNGAIDYGELMMCMKDLHFDTTNEQIADIMRVYDADRNHTLEILEFLDLVSKVFEFRKASRRPRDDIERAFRKYDTDNNGVLDTAEIAACLNACGVATSTDAAQKIMAKYDTSGDGGLQLREFRKLVEELRDFYARRSRWTTLSGSLCASMMITRIRSMPAS